MPEASKQYQFADFVVAVVFFASPLVWIFFTTFKAVYAGYYMGLITDPGHRWIKFLDTVVVILTIAATSVAVASSYGFNFDAFSRATSESPYLILFGQFSGWLSFAIMYGLSSFLYVFGKYREQLVEKINEWYGVW